MIQLSIGEEQLLTTIRLLELRPRDWETGEEIIASQRNLYVRGKLYFGKSFADWTSVFESLAEKDLLHSDGSTYCLTNLGRPIADIAQRKWFITGYDALLMRSERSSAHSIFCAQVYGRDLCQTSNVDMIQLNKMLEVLSLSPDSLVLDLGCGSGEITSYLSDVTQARFIGVDIATNAIYRAQKRIRKSKNRVQFLEADLNHLSFAEACADAILALDTIYFADGLARLIKQLARVLKPQGQLAIFFSQFCYPKDPTTQLLPGNTDLALALRKHGLWYHAYDLTTSEQQLRRRQMLAAAELRDEFAAEGNMDIHKIRNTEAKWALKILDAERGRRYLYHAKRS